MSAQHPPLTCDEFKATLKAMGFQSRPMKSGTSHEDWVATINGVFRKVTVDCPKAPFSQDLIGSMAHQAGVTKNIIYDYHFGRLPKRQEPSTITQKPTNYPKTSKKTHHTNKTGSMTGRIRAKESRVPSLCSGSSGLPYSSITSPERRCLFGLCLGTSPPGPPPYFFCTSTDAR